MTLLEFIQEQYGAETYSNKLLLTLQRRVLNWRHIDGPAQEVKFNQQHILINSVRNQLLLRNISY